MTPWAENERARGVWMRTVSFVEDIPTLFDDTTNADEEVTETMGRQHLANRDDVTDLPAPERAHRPIRPVKGSPQAAFRQHIQLSPLPLSTYGTEMPTQIDDDSLALDPTEEVELAPDPSEELELLADWLETEERPHPSAEPVRFSEPMPLETPIAPRITPRRPPARAFVPPPSTAPTESRSRIGLIAWWTLGAMSGMAVATVLVASFAVALLVV